MTVTSAHRTLLHQAARMLTPLRAGHPDADLLARIAHTDPTRWDEGMSVRAAAAIEPHHQLLAQVGFDPFLLPALSREQAATHTQPAPPQASAPAPQVPQGWQHAASDHHEGLATGADAYEGAVRDEPFDYEHTIVGLQGIPMSELGCVTKWNASGYEAAGIHTAFDALMHIPLRYIDRSTRTMIGHITTEADVTLLAKVKHVKKERITSRKNPKARPMPVAKITVTDPTGDAYLTFFNAPYQADRVKPGDEVIVQGKASVRVGDSRRFVSFANPLIDRAGDQNAPVLPVYRQLGLAEAARNKAARKKATEDEKAAKKRGETTTASAPERKVALTTWMVHRAVTEIVNRMGELSDPIPAHLLTNRGLMGRKDAFVAVHTPNRVGAEQPARDRLAYDELLRMQLALGMRRHVAASRKAITHAPTGALTGQVLARMPYQLTGAQARCLTQIKADMVAATPMHALLQGDVGAGKSTVALMTLLMALEGGYQGALMAPTSVLAQQLYTEFHEYAQGLTHPDGRPVRVEFIPNRQKTRARREVDEGLRDGSVDILVGTHGLIEDDVTFRNLGVVIVDEQHRFGVEQRAKLRAKGPDGATPDMLAMTATPIPRTSAMTVFGDLSVLVLDELPPGRTPIQTRHVDDEPAYDDPNSAVWAPVRQAVREGRQAYVVCPLVDDSETKAANAAVQVRDALSAGALRDMRVGIVHGKQKDDERAEQMGAFKAGEVDVLVATTVIEVGVSVPNTTHIVITEPKKFGISQLHQLRGRVGRGQYPGFCTLYGEVGSEDGKKRMSAICSTTDGFKLADMDLQIRGAGQILGSAQSGLSDLKVASLDTDAALIAAAREDADQLLVNDHTLGKRPALRAEVMAALGTDGAEWLARS